MDERIIETIDDDSWCDFLDTPLALLVLAVSTCPACAAWEEELATWLSADTRWIGARAGKVALDSPDTATFKHDNEWLDDIPGLPFTAVFVNGEPRTSLVGGGISRLERRLEGLGLPLETIFWKAANAQPINATGAVAPLTATRSKTQGGSDD